MIDALSLLPNEKDDKFDSRYRIVLVAAQRAKQLMQGAHSSVSSKMTKPTSLALEEVLQDQVSFVVGSEARQALKETQENMGRQIDPSLLGLSAEDTHEIKKELSVYVDDSPKVEGPTANE